ncbi:MAG: sensor histidine kinase [Clostridium sp.]|uniref:sensor histidine kinase n=1 Tax=Clostridium sp. TaxID=1506 RepID=UPI003F36535E
MLIYEMLSKKEEKERWYSDEESKIRNEVNKRTIFERTFMYTSLLVIFLMFLLTREMGMTVDRLIIISIASILAFILLSTIYNSIRYYYLYKKEENKYKNLYKKRSKKLIFQLILLTMGSILIYSLITSNFGIRYMNHNKVEIGGELISGAEIVIGEHSSFIIFIEAILIVYLLFSFIKENVRLSIVNTTINNFMNRAKNGEVKIIKESLDKEINFEKSESFYGENYSMIIRAISKLVVKVQEAGLKEGRSENDKNELITNVSHDLKTPLTSIINYTYILKNKQYTKEEREKYIEILDDKSKRLNDILIDLKGIANTDKSNIAFEELDIFYTVAQFINESKAKLEKKNLNIIFENNIEKIVKLNKKSSLRVLQNIIDNIRKYSKENSDILVSFNENNDYISVKFKNISKYEMNFSKEDAIRRFWRGDSSRSTEGHGLGLDICKSLMELQGGVFDIDIDGDTFISIISFKK